MLEEVDVIVLLVVFLLFINVYVLCKLLEM